MVFYNLKEKLLLFFIMDNISEVGNQLNGPLNRLLTKVEAVRRS
jgi:hypothetical protein